MQELLGTIVFQEPAILGERGIHPKLALSS
jgi:hypothetical protein